VGRTLEEREIIYAKHEMTDADGMKLGELEGIVGEEDGYTAESDAAILLQGLDIPDEMQRTEDVGDSGRTENARIAGAGFIRASAGAVLDEPTNHLDLDSIHWLKTFLNQYEGVLIVISA